MTQHGLAVFDSTVQTTHVWVNDVLRHLGWADEHRGYRALRAVLHALRDRLPVNQVAALAAQLPLLVRGVYYEGWHPQGKPLKEHREAFLAHVAVICGDDIDVSPEQIARAVFGVLAEHVSEGEIESLKQCLPAGIRTLWP